ncbi:MAG: ADP-ribosylation factor-like protein [Candidatus Thorarchaeota archaeon]
MSAEEEILGKKKLIMMGLAQAGKTTIRRAVISGLSGDELERYDATIDYERETKRIAGESLSVIDIGGQESFLEKYTGEMAEFAFSEVASMIYVIDVSELSRLPRSVYYFAAACKKLEEFSPDARIYCFLHKVDLLEPETTQETLDMVKSMMGPDIPGTVEYLPTSIYDGSAYMAMSEAVSIFLGKKGDILGSMERFAEKYQTTRICLYSREGIPITTFGKDSSTWQVNEKLLFSAMFRILNQIDPSEALSANFIIGRNHYLFLLVVDENTLLSATTRKIPELERVLADVYTMRDELRVLVQ